MEKIKIAFFGHRDVYMSAAQRVRLKTLVSSLIQNRDLAEFYFGGYGRFDREAYDCAREAAAASSCKCKFCYVIPYISPAYLLRHSHPRDMYDEIVYLGSESVPPRIAIIDRNKKIVQMCDMIIFSVARTYGGAYRALRYAERKNVAHVNLTSYALDRN